MKRAHEGLQNYIKQLRGPGEVQSLTPNPRLAVGPDAPLPIGFRPIPTSSQRPKPTNATIVYARTAVADCNDLGRSRGAMPVASAISEGDVVLTHRMEPATSVPLGQNVKVLSVRLMNEDLRRMGPMTEAQYEAYFLDKEKTHFKWCPDGVVNNLDGADPTNEFKDFAIANVAIQGFVRFSTLPFGEATRWGHQFPNTFTQKGVRNGDRVYLALMALEAERPNPLPNGYEDRYAYQFMPVLASHITTGKFRTHKPRGAGVGESYVRKAWTLGRVVDGNQSKNMVTLCVGVAPVLTPGEDLGLNADHLLDRAWLHPETRWAGEADSKTEVTKRLSAINDTIYTYEKEQRRVLKETRTQYWPKVPQVV